DAARLGIERPLHLGVRLPADHPLRDLHRLAALGPLEHRDAVHAGNEGGIVLDVDERVVDALAWGVDERPVVELDEAVAIGRLLVDQQVLGSAPVDLTPAGGEQKRGEKARRGTQHAEHGAPPQGRFSSPYSVPDERSTGQASCGRRPAAARSTMRCRRASRSVHDPCAASAASSSAGARKPPLTIVDPRVSMTRRHSASPSSKPGWSRTATSSSTLTTASRYPPAA